MYAHHGFIDWELLYSTTPDQANLELAEFKDADLITHFNKYGSNLLQVYISWARPIDPTCIKQIIAHLSQGRFDINHTNSFGETALNRVASQQACLEVWIILIEKGSDVNVIDELGRNLIQWYLIYNNPRSPLVLKLLFRSGF